MSDRKNNNPMESSKESFVDKGKIEETSYKKSDRQYNMNEYEGRREERRRSLENAFLQTMDPFA